MPCIAFQAWCMLLNGECSMSQPACPHALDRRMTWLPRKTFFTAASTLRTMMSYLAKAWVALMPVAAGIEHLSQASDGSCHRQSCPSCAEQAYELHACKLLDRCLPDLTKISASAASASQMEPSLYLCNPRLLQGR